MYGYVEKKVLKVNSGLFLAKVRREGLGVIYKKDLFLFFSLYVTLFEDFLRMYLYIIYIILKCIKN